MVTEHDGEPPREPTAEPAYERRDASSRWLFGLVGILAVCVALAQVVLRRVHAHLEKSAVPTDAWTGARAEGLMWTQVNYPRLQLSAPEDLGKFRKQEEAELNSYGWINQTSGTMRIPIERTMELIAQRGLPVRAGIGQSRLGPTPFELQQQRTNSTQAETVIAR